jgi:disulfide bond formation protein DsbB
LVQTTITFFALLALLALAGTIAILFSLVRRSPKVEAVLGPRATFVAAAVAIVATAGSLFMSEVAGFIPCLLCWVQRGFMYPLAVLIPLRRRLRLPPTLLGATALVGAAVSAFHYAEERIPALSEASFCSPAIPCSFVWFERFGFVTLPFMAFCGFVAIASLMALERRMKPVLSDLKEET